MEKLYTSPEWPDSVDWLSRHKGKIVVMTCRKCSFHETYRVDDILGAEGTDIAINSLSVVIARNRQCDRLTATGYEACRLQVDRFADEPAAKQAKGMEFPRGIRPLPDMVLHDVPLSYGVCAYCPCGWQRSVSLREIAIGLPDGTKVSDILPRLVCRRCRNTRGNVLAYMVLGR